MKNVKGIDGRIIHRALSEEKANLRRSCWKVLKENHKERPCFGRPAVAIVIKLPFSSGVLLLLFGGDCHYGRGFPSGASCRIFWGSHENGPVVPTHAHVTPHKTNQEQRRYRPPKKSRGGGIDLGTPAIGTIFQADGFAFFHRAICRFYGFRCHCFGLRFSAGTKLRVNPGSTELAVLRSGETACKVEVSGELRIAPDLQEVIDRINQIYFSVEIRRAKDDRAREQEHRPGFHIPRITRDLARFIFSA
jgi:hypothetical protein